ncbi:hypothetical protein ACFQ1S_02205 [Kibdelosporangium lantanae]|uniref:Uncharacterized protein n=1 Tax=Kibdelosporangium lantanae TaxID=1497396 RepID=A0ABW3M690_9PSEU
MSTRSRTSGDTPATERTPLDPDRPATVDAVRTLEETVREAPEWVVLRYGLFYGPTTWYASDGLKVTWTGTAARCATGTS